jgi:hypothetical protein
MNSYEFKNHIDNVRFHLQMLLPIPSALQEIIIEYYYTSPDNVESLVIVSPAVHYTVSCTNQKSIRYWRAHMGFTNRDKSLCSVVNCHEIGIKGAIVSRYWKPSTEYYVIPMCHRHSRITDCTLNTRSNVQILKVKCPCYPMPSVHKAVGDWQIERKDQCIVM